MSEAGFENKIVGELTVKEFRVLMQNCLDNDRLELQKRANEEFQRNQRVLLGMFNSNLIQDK